MHGTGLRERKKAATRTALRDAARELVAERGLAGTTVEAVAERADVSPRTFFNHFASKEEAVLGWEPERIDALAADLRAALGAGAAPLDALEVVLTAFVRDEQVTSDGLRRRLDLLRREPLLLATSWAHWQQVTDALRDAVAGVAPGAYAELAVQVAIAAVRSSLLHWSVAGGSPTAAIASAFTTLRAGLPAPGRTPTIDLSPDLEP